MRTAATRQGRHPVRGGLLASVVLLGAGSAAQAQTAPRFDLQIERDTRPRTSILSNLSVAYRVTVRDRVTGGPPERHVVFAQATNQQGEKTPSFACGHTNDVDARTPPGVFDCTVIVDHGGAWTFVAVVLEERTDPRMSPAPLAQGSVPFDLATDEITTDEVPGAEISASVGDVAVLFGHAVAAAAWFACVALLIALALPGARRFLSSHGRHRLERRLDTIVKATWITTGLVTGSGVYLTFTATAYDAPFSSSAVEAVFKLPYGKPYFLALATKIALYLLMVGAAIPLLRAAQRRLLSRDDVSPPLASMAGNEDEVSAGRSTGGGVACDVRTAAPLVTAAPEPVPAGGGNVRLRAAVAVIAGGGVGMAVCVTLLKYLHELIESARGLL
ncbi:MAG: hypothetical protein AB1679_22535 [Actinomycetota bacterium]|jgi:hypothetical protein